MDYKFNEPIIKRNKIGVEYYTGHDGNTSKEYKEIDDVVAAFYKTQNGLIGRHYVHKVPKNKFLFKLRTRFNKAIKRKIVIVYEAIDSFSKDYQFDFTQKEKYDKYRIVKSNIEFLYAIFVTPEVSKDSLVDILDKLRKYVINDWLPNSDYHFTYEGEILVFDERYYNSAKKVVEFWLPVSKTKVLEFEYEWRLDEDKGNLY